MAILNNIRTDNGYFSGDTIGLSSLGNKSIYNAPIEGGFYSGAASGYETAAKQATLTKEAKALTDKTSTTASSFVSSSAPVVQQEKDTTKTVQDLMGSITPPKDETGSAQTASDAYMKLIDDQTAALEKRRADEVARISGQFDQAEAGLKTTQKSETGTTGAMLARSGGYLGNTGSGTGVLLNLAATHKSEIATLQAKRADAIQQANNAITDKQFALAQLKVKEVKDIEQTIHDRKNEFFNNSLKAVTEARQQDEAYRKKITDDLDMLGKLSLNDTELKLDPAKASEIDSYYGTPGFTQQYLTTVRNAAKAKEAKDRIAVQKDTLDLLSKIPVGQKLTFPDGTSYIGLGSAEDVSSSLQVDDLGVGRMVNYNKRTGQVTVVPVGMVGKTSDSGSGGQKDVVFDNVKAKFSTALEAAKDPKTGLYDPDIYLEVRQELKKNPNIAGYVDDVDKVFLNPANDLFSSDAINRLRSKGIFSDDRKLP